MTDVIDPCPHGGYLLNKEADSSGGLRNTFINYNYVNSCEEKELNAVII